MAKLLQENIDANNQLLQQVMQERPQPVTQKSAFLKQSTCRLRLNITSSICRELSGRTWSPAAQPALSGLGPSKHTSYYSFSGLSSPGDAGEGAACHLEISLRLPELLLQVHGGTLRQDRVMVQQYRQHNQHHHHPMKERISLRTSNQVVLLQIALSEHLCCRCVHQMLNPCC